MKAKQLLAGVVLVGVMAMGAGYAAWNQEFSTKTIVNTAEMSFDLSTKTGAYDGKYIKSSIKSHTADASMLEFTIDNAYPGAAQQFEITVKNTGTIGMRLETEEKHETDDGVTIQYRNFQGENSPVTIEPGEEGKFFLTVHVLDDAAKKDTITFNHKINFVQYNK